MSSQYVHIASVNHIASTYADCLSRHLVPANHHCVTLQAGVKPPLWHTTDPYSACGALYRGCGVKTRSNLVRL